MPFLNFCGHQIPFVEHQYAFHVGTGSKQDRATSRFSLEGRGVSISHCPDSWRKIARLGSAPCHRLQSANDTPLSLLDVHCALDNPALVHTVHSWAEGKNYLRRGKLYQVTQYDEEGNEGFMMLTSHNEALAEADDDESLIEEKDGYLPTPLLAARMEVSTVDPALSTEYALLAMAEEVFHVDGAWWEDELDPGRLSAPRGVIFESTLPQILWELHQPVSCSVPGMP